LNQASIATEMLVRNDIPKLNLSKQITPTKHHWWVFLLAFPALPTFNWLAWNCCLVCGAGSIEGDFQGVVM